MLTKAIIVEVNRDGYSARVRIPKFDKIHASSSTIKDENLLVATMCTPPGVHPVYSTGDVVFVDFEDDSLNNPVILGCLYSSKFTSTLCDISSQSIKVISNSDLSNATSIGNLSEQEIQNMKTIPSQLDIINSRLDKLES